MCQLWWSIWLSVVWGGFWASTAVWLMVPSVWNETIGSVIPNAKKYTGILRALSRYESARERGGSLVHRYAKLVTWMVAVWISFTPLVINHFIGDSTSNSRSDLTILANILFGLFLCTIILGIEKLIIQLIAFQFHRDSYEDRLKDQKFQLRCLTTLYINSHDVSSCLTGVQR